MTSSDTVPQDKRPIDREALRRKYAEERAKRLRPDGNAQYLQMAGRFARYLEDPYMPVVPRAPRTDHVTFALLPALANSRGTFSFSCRGAASSAYILTYTE